MNNMKYLVACLYATLLFACNVADKKAPGNDSTNKLSVEDEGRLAAQDRNRSTTLEWLDSTEQNLGKLERGQVAEISWKFKNTGNKPLYVTSVRASCGCTIPEKPNEPIAPGATSLIKAKFNSTNFTGHVIKEIYVEANNSNHNNGANNKIGFTADIK